MQSIPNESGEWAMEMEDWKLHTIVITPPNPAHAQVEVVSVH